MEETYMNKRMKVWKRLGEIWGLPGKVSIEGKIIRIFLFTPIAIILICLIAIIINLLIKSFS